MSEETWIDFVELPREGKRKTVRIEVQTRSKPSVLLGIIKWYGGWRRYCFFPVAETVYESNCLRTIATYCEDRTRAYANQRYEQARAAEINDTLGLAGSKVKESQE